MQLADGHQNHRSLLDDPEHVAGDDRAAHRDGVAEDADEAVGELVGGLGLEEERVDVVVLDEVARAGANDVQRAGDNGPGLAGAGHRCQLRLILLEVLQLLRQRDRVLDHTQCHKDQIRISLFVPRSWNPCWECQSVTDDVYLHT
jgi:hypothetical protein